MLPVLSVASNGEIRIGAAVDRLAEKIGLTPAERAEPLPSGKQSLFSNRVHWAKTYLNKAGLIESTRRRALGRSGGDGVDGVIDQDALGLDRVYIQAKRYAVGNNIGSGAIRDFFGSLDRHKATKGLFVTTSVFSPSARETAEFL
jgi:restriction endonuclease Mrr